MHPFLTRPLHKQELFHETPCFLCKIVLRWKENVLPLASESPPILPFFRSRLARCVGKFLLLEKLLDLAHQFMRRRRATGEPVQDRAMDDAAILRNARNRSSAPLAIGKRDLFAESVDGVHFAMDIILVKVNSQPCVQY